MADKTFKSFDDVRPDDLIGGDRRLKRQKIPMDVGEVPGLVNPSIESHALAFGREIAGRRLVVEVGPGKGAFLSAMAGMNPDSMCVGFESRLAFALTTLKRARRDGRENLRVVWGDARVTIPLLVPPGSADQAYLLFPDPWWKKKHARRRHGPVMARVLGDALATGGLMVIKSDVEGYLDILAATFLESGLFAPADLPEAVPSTNREARIVRNMEKVFAAALTRK